MHQPYSIRPALWIFLFYRFLQVLLNDPVGFCFFSLHKAVKSAVPPGATELSVSCAARARMEGSATTSLGSAPALLDGRYGTCSFRGWNGELIAYCLSRCLPCVLMVYIFYFLPWGSHSSETGASFVMLAQHLCTSLCLVTTYKELNKQIKTTHCSSVWEKKRGKMAYAVLWNIPALLDTALTWVTWDRKLKAHLGIVKSTVLFPFQEKGRERSQGECSGSGSL